MVVRKTDSNRTAFTLVELLVVIAIIGILIAMLLPAVQQVREAARRIECANKIRQLGLAVINYESAHNHFPSGWIGGQDGPTETGWGWTAQILPFMEQVAVANQIQLTENLVEYKFDEVVVNHIPNLFCPSSTHNTTTFELEVVRIQAGSDSAIGIGFHDEPEPEPYFIGRTHYVGCIGSSVQQVLMDANDDGEGEGEMCPDLNLLSEYDRNINGVFYQNSETGYQHLLDGSSNTILLGERSSGTFDSSWAGVVTGSEFAGWRVVGWTGEPPNNEVSTDQAHFHGFAQFNSMHTGGVTNFAFADGSVHSVDENVTAELFFAMGTIHGGEIIDHSAY